MPHELRAVDPVGQGVDGFELDVLPELGHEVLEEAGRDRTDIGVPDSPFRLQARAPSTRATCPRRSCSCSASTAARAARSRPTASPS